MLDAAAAQALYDETYENYRQAREAARGADARRSQDLVLREQRNGSGRRCTQTRARRDEACEADRSRRRVSRKNVRRAFGQRTRSVSRAVRAAARRRTTRA